jgi:GT2 family glycosyltransferase
VKHAADVTIIIPTWQRASWLRRCLVAALRQEPLPREVLVVGRHDDSDAHLVTRDTAENARVPVGWLEVSSPGHVAPVRKGLEASEGEIVAFLDDDAEPQHGWLAACLGPFADPKVACVGGRVVTHGFRGKVRRDAGRIRWYGKHIGNVGAVEATGPLRVDAVMEGNWAWRRDVLLGLEFDPVLDFDDASMYGLDLCLQARSRGYKILYQPAARVTHRVAPRHESLDRRDRPRRTYTFARNYTYIGLKHFRGMQRAAFIAWWWGVGPRGAYGLLTSAWDLAARRNGVRQLTASSFAGKQEGLRLWRAR